MAILAALVAVPLALGTGCNRPSEADCKKAVTNIRKLTKTDRDDFGVKPEAAIRSCRGNADKASVKCIGKAETLADLEKCEGDFAQSMLGGGDDKGGDDKGGDEKPDKPADGDKTDGK
jgi:hypothetical protein